MKNIIRKQTIKIEEWEEIENRASSAQFFLTDKRFAFIVDFFNQNREEIHTLLMENRIKDVDEILTISDKLKKVFHIPAKVQVDELIGQHKLIKQFFTFLQDAITLKTDLEAKEARKQLLIERSKEV
jgi:hypothetical protein